MIKISDIQLTNKFKQDFNIFWNIVNIQIYK